MEVIKLLRQAQANAKNKGLDSTNLVINNILAKKAAQSWHSGRQRRRRMKRTHVEVTLTEAKTKMAVPEASQKAGQRKPGTKGTNKLAATAEATAANAAVPQKQGVTA